MKTAVIPGSFDPITVGHVDIIKRASKIFDKVIVVVANNSEKKYMLNNENRLELVTDAVKDILNASVAYTSTYLVDFIAENGNPCIVKGIRNSDDFDYEKNMADINKNLSKERYGFEVETMFLFSNKKYHDVSSTKVRLLINNSEDCSSLVPNYQLLSSLLKLYV